MGFMMPISTAPNAIVYSSGLHPDHGDDAIRPRAGSLRLRRHRRRGDAAWPDSVLADDMQRRKPDGPKTHRDTIPDTDAFEREMAGVVRLQPDPRGTRPRHTSRQPAGVATVPGACARSRRRIPVRSISRRQALIGARFGS